MKPILISELVGAVKGTLLCGKETTQISSVHVNSKEVEAGALFIPLIGEKVDAHRFIDGALEQGAVAVLTSKLLSLDEMRKDKSYVYVTDTLKALQDFATYYRNLFHMPVIGITGSVGKTTTKEMMAAALETKLHVLKTIGNRNSQIGVSLMMFELEDDIDVAIIEMGISEEGEMQRLVAIAKPDAAVITNIGVSHIAQLGSQTNIRREKLNIINELSSSGARVYVCGNDALLSELKDRREYVDCSTRTKEKLQHAEVVLYGTEGNCDYLAENIQTQGDETHFTVTTPSQRSEATLSVLGIHNVNNALVAFAVADQFHISFQMAAEGLRQYQPIAMRGQMIEKNGIRIIDDTYNASPDSMKSGLQVLFEHECTRKRIAVLGDILELGEVAEESHRQIGQFITRFYQEGRKLDQLITVGVNAKAIADVIQEEKVGILTASFLKKEETTDYLNKILEKGDLVWMKGSRGMHLDEIVKAVTS